ncbi:MAG: hypothetical protein HY707_09335 [Ignavibacteriae bacterium]|nr:hypothetical protein [Ignavibacteriota bacterium]
MLEQETELITSAIKHRILVGGQHSAHVAVKDILAADIPHPIKTLFRADVEATLMEELHRHRRDSRFNYDHPEVKSLQHQMNSVLVLNYTYTQDEFLHRLDDFVNMMINYLIRPQWTLTNMLFEKAQSISSAEVLKILRCFGAFEYLKEIIARYIQDKNISTFNKKDFSNFVRKAEGEYIRRKTGDELARVMTPMFEFLDFPKTTSNKALPIRSLIKFFEDKGLTTILTRLESENAQGKKELTQLDLSELLEDVRRTSGAFEVERLEEKSDSSADAKDTTTPIPFPALLSVDSLFDEADKRRFVKKIFKQDEQAFNTTLQSMSKLQTWKDASKFIDEIFIRNDVDPYSTEAVRFTALIQQQYYPKK